MPEPLHHQATVHFLVLTNSAFFNDLNERAVELQDVGECRRQTTEVNVGMDQGRYVSSKQLDVATHQPYRRQLCLITCTNGRDNYRLHQQLSAAPWWVEWSRELQAPTMEY